MATRALIVLAALVAVLLGAWFYSGWHDVRSQQLEVSQAPRVAAADRAGALARELQSELENLIGREWRRPYFHYQNLMHDPNSSPGLNVSPSPLARGTGDALVLGYFQLDAKGQVSTPTINDEVPKLSEPEHLAANQAFRARVKQDLLPEIAPTLPAKVAVRRAPPPAKPRPAPEPEDPRWKTESQSTQIIRVDPKVYSQNANPSQVYSQQSSGFPLPVAPPPAPVTITISPLEWRTLPFAGAPALVAVRQVQTPDGTFAQGFVVDPSTLSNWVAARTGDMIATLSPGSSAGVEVVPGWRLTVAPQPQRLAQADADAQSIARTFLLQFAAVATLAIGAAVFVVVLVRRAESLALERSRFAAAAAHELRTPLAGLQLYGDLLADGLGDPDKMRDYARRMSEEASRLGRVVSNVLTFSQLERDHLRIEATAGPLGEVLRELAERARPTVDRTGATLEVDVPPELRARFDRDALARIVANLIDNAEKYARSAGDRTIRLTAHERGNGVDVTIEDRGPGIADESKLFKPFSRGASGTDSPAGLGLGLVLSMSLARAMGGELTYHPRAGGGATFVLRLPAA
jgi:signal transduction histidine kinase